MDEFLKRQKIKYEIITIVDGYVDDSYEKLVKMSENNSKKFFIKGLRRIFDKEDVPENILEDYYKQGLYHPA